MDTAYYRKALRLKSTAFDEEIEALIESAELDLTTSNIKRNIDTSNPLVVRAITLYVQLHFGIDGVDHDRLSRMYESLKVHLSLSGDYT